LIFFCIYIFVFINLFIHLFINFLVFADELAPYLNPPLISDDAKSQSMGGTSSETAAAAVVVDESWMLDTLIKLGGKHFVTEDGDILYGIKRIFFFLMNYFFLIFF